jgi:hypothetical protein
LRRERCTTNSMRGLRRRHPVSVRRPGFATHMPAAFHCVAIRRDVTSTLSVTRSVTQCTRRPARHAAYAASAAKSPDGWVTSGCGTYATTSGSHGAILRSRSSTSWTCFPTPPGRGCMWATPRDIRRPTSSRATSACAASMSFIPWVGMPTVCRRALCGTHRSPSGHHHKAKHRDLPFAAEAAGLLIRVLLFGIPFMRPEPGGFRLPRWNGMPPIYAVSHVSPLCGVVAPGGDLHAGLACPLRRLHHALDRFVEIRAGVVEMESPQQGPVAFSEMR